MRNGILWKASTCSCGPIIPVVDDFTVKIGQALELPHCFPPLFFIFTVSFIKTSTIVDMIFFFLLLHCYLIKLCPPELVQVLNLALCL
jgi:hypothetical protein